MTPDADLQIDQIVNAPTLRKTQITVSCDRDDKRSKKVSESKFVTVKSESLDSFINSIVNYERIRTCSKNIPFEIYEKAAETNKYVADQPPVKNGRVELINYIKEQSISFEYHRYGSITEIPEID